MKASGLFILTFFIALALVSSPQRPGKKQSRKKPVTDTIITHATAGGTEITLHFVKGKAHNHPMMAVWIEDQHGNYLQTLYVNESVAKGYFSFADKSAGKWQPGPTVRPASLPVWAHKRGVKSDEGHYMPTQRQPMPDAVTSPTPPANFILRTRTQNTLTDKFTLWFEINQSWDWNEYWTNNKFPDDEEYKSSAQPSVVYMTEIDPRNPQEKYVLKPVGHGHYSGKDGKIYPDLHTLTTALQIASEIYVTVRW